MRIVPAAIGAPPPCGGRYFASTSEVITRVCSMAEICSATFFSWRMLPRQ